MVFMKERVEAAKPLLRIGLSLVFLYFGFQQLIDASGWTAYVPEIFSSLNPLTLVMVNGLLEVILGIFLLIGLYTRVSALVLAIHLLGIAISIGFNPLGVRDFGLALATFVVFLQGRDFYCLDEKLHKK
jgi:uncharacterized membrane protein YphA (DoxX/SURF4 family)